MPSVNVYKGNEISRCFPFLPNNLVRAMGTALLCNGGARPLCGWATAVRRGNVVAKGFERGRRKQPRIAQFSLLHQHRCTSVQRGAFDPTLCVGDPPGAGPNRCGLFFRFRR